MSSSAHLRRVAEAVAEEDVRQEHKRMKKDKELQDFQIAYFCSIQIGLGIFKNHIVFKIAYF